jgi:hypothetical protein
MFVTHRACRGSLRQLSALGRTGSSGASPSSVNVAGLLRVLSSRKLLDQLASLPGYDPARCGEHVASL